MKHIPVLLLFLIHRLITYLSLLNIFSISVGFVCKLATAVDEYCIYISP